MARTNPEMLAAFLALINTQMERKRDRSIAEEGRAFALAMQKMNLETQAKISQEKSILDQLIRDEGTYKTQADNIMEEIEGYAILGEGLTSIGGQKLYAEKVQELQAKLTNLKQGRNDIEKQRNDKAGNLFKLKSIVSDARDIKKDRDAGFADEPTAQYLMDIQKKIDPRKDVISQHTTSVDEIDKIVNSLNPNDPVEGFVYQKLQNPVYRIGVVEKMGVLGKEGIKTTLDVRTVEAREARNIVARNQLMLSLKRQHLADEQEQRRMRQELRSQMTEARLRKDEATYQNLKNQWDESFPGEPVFEEKPTVEPPVQEIRELEINRDRGDVEAAKKLKDYELQGMYDPNLVDYIQNLFKQTGDTDDTLRKEAVRELSELRKEGKIKWFDKYMKFTQDEGVRAAGGQKQYDELMKKQIQAKKKRAEKVRKIQEG